MCVCVCVHVCAHFALPKPTYLFYIITLLTHPTSFFILHFQHIKIIYLLPTCYHSNTWICQHREGGIKNNDIHGATIIFIFRCYCGNMYCYLQ